jgi:hypothetical protein
MPSLTSLHHLAACALMFACAVQAAEQKPMTNAMPASAVAAPTANRVLQMDTRHPVAATLTLRGIAPIASGWTAQFRFAGQTDLHACVFALPKVGQLVRPGETATGTIQCSTPWQLYDNGLAFDALQDGRKLADGTLRPN